MVFDYYYNLSKKQQLIYQRSDKIEKIPLRNPYAIREYLSGLNQALALEDRRKVEAQASKLINALVEDTGAPKVNTRVLDVRPADDWGELHGLYEPEDGKPAKITVWMRTVKYKKVVAFRTFLRTLLHEFCHHLDYELFRLQESYHTEGFFKRESSLYKQLVVEGEQLSLV